MGLDMYLRAEKYFSGYDLNGNKKVADLGSYIVYLSELSSLIDPESFGITVNVTVAHWRKANQIHCWFVNNAQDGIDDCKSYCVSKDQLEHLLKICTDILSYRDKATAKTLLPTMEGFFFGSEDYDEYYFDDLRSTVDQLTRVLNNQEAENVTFYYESSW